MMTRSYYRSPRAIFALLLMLGLCLSGCGGSAGRDSSSNGDFQSSLAAGALNGGSFGGDGLPGDSGGPRGPISPGDGNPTVFVPNTPSIPSTLASVALTPNPLALNVGSTRQLTVTGTSSDGATAPIAPTDSGVSFVSANPAVANVSTSGLVTGVSVGNTTVSVTVVAQNSTVTASVPVTVTAAGSVTPSFALYVTQTPGFPANSNPANWGGVLGFLVAGSGGPFTPGTGIPRSQLGDPAAISFRPSSSEVFVSNRLGNNSTSGVPGSVSRFIYDSATRTFTDHGSFQTTSPALQTAFHPVTGDLYVGLTGPDFGFPGGVARYTFDSLGTASLSGTLIPGTTVRGVTFSPSGNRLYVTTANNVIRQFNPATGVEFTPVTETPNPNFHYMAVRNGQLYAGGISGNGVYRYNIDPVTEDLTFVDKIPAATAISVAFSPDGQEMYAPGHIGSDVIHRFSFNSATSTWTPTTPFSTGSSLGGILVLP